MRTNHLWNKIKFNFEKKTLRKTKYALEFLCWKKKTNKIKYVTFFLGVLKLMYELEGRLYHVFSMRRALNLLRVIWKGVLLFHGIYAFVWGRRKFCNRKNEIGTIQVLGFFSSKIFCFVHQLAVNWTEILLLGITLLPTKIS